MTEQDPATARLAPVGIAAAGAVTELLSSRNNDDLSIPLVAGAVAALLL